MPIIDYFTIFTNTIINCFSPQFAQIDLLAEISQSPRILSEVDVALKAKQIKGDVDEYLKVSGLRC